MTFEKKTKHLEKGPIYKVQGKTIKLEKTLLYSGVYFDKNLSFIPHLAQKLQEVIKATQNPYKFSSILRRISPHFFKFWYSAILQRCLTYACAVYFMRMSSQHYCRHLLSAQKSALLLMS